MSKRVTRLRGQLLVIKPGQPNSLKINVVAVASRNKTVLHSTSLDIDF